MSDTEIRLIAPRSQDWGAFECGDARISAKLVREAHRAQAGLQQLHGVMVAGDLAAVMTLRAGHLSAPVNVLMALGMGEIEVPTLHLEVLAVRTDAQRRGLGKLLISIALDIAVRLQGEIGLKTVSLEATTQSRAFYQNQGFEAAESPWPDGSWAMWFLLN
ncbi:GNAT family N-acetyltransferase [Deinococcus sp.]|uniref:GNAT family N-acetyltransferase n=1 Tax=Deinococcus sp. TaxID=47478 RepID=UPI003B5BFECD